MSDKVQGWVWDLPDLLPQRRLILLWLANRATDNGVCFPGQAEVRRKTGLGEKMVRRHLHWLASDRDDDGRPKQPLLTIIERRVDADRNTSNVYVLHVPWARPRQVARELDELKHVPPPTLAALHQAGEGVTDDPQGPNRRAPAPGGGGRERPPKGSPESPMGVVGGREEPGHRDSHPGTDSPPHPPPATADPQRQGGQEDAKESALPSQLSQDADVAARVLVTAFYRGLGAEPDAATVTIRRRDVAIARQLVAAGATPTEAEAYAREASATPGRLAPLDLRSFERERLGWLARRRATLAGHEGFRLVTGMGLPD
jgi:hypothetical protein